MLNNFVLSEYAINLTNFPVRDELIPRARKLKAEESIELLTREPGCASQ